MRPGRVQAVALRALPDPYGHRPQGAEPGGGLEHRLSGELEARESSRQSLKDDRCFEPGQGASDADMHAETEREVGVRPPTQLDPVGLLECALVAGGRRLTEDDIRGPAQPPAGDLQIFRDPTVLQL